MARKKLKDLKKGDRIWYYGYTCTTPIYVDKAKRTRNVVEVMIRWDDHEYVGYGHALGYIMVSYDRKFRSDNILFTTDYDDVKTRERKEDVEKAERELGHDLMLFLKQLNKTQDLINKKLINDGKRKE